MTVFCTTQKWDNVSTPYYPISALLSSARSREVKDKRTFQFFLALKVVAVAYERWSLTEVPNIVISFRNFWYFGKLIAEESLSLTRGDRNPLVATGGSTGRLFLADSAEYCLKRRASKKKKKNQG